ncbi:transposase [Frankia sp. Hr75.2]|nr:transposase [Frankia sp. Hr75.2]
MVAAFMAEQVGVADPGCLKGYPDRLPTQHEHAREIRDLLGYRTFGAAEEMLRAFLASRVWTSTPSRRELFDRAVPWLLGERVLLPGITVLARAVADVRTVEQDRIHQVLREATPVEMRRELVGLLRVPDGKHVSTLEEMRTDSDRGVRAGHGRGVGPGVVGVGGGDRRGGRGGGAAGETRRARRLMVTKATTIRGLQDDRKVATVLATVRRLEAVSVDDALLLFDILMATKLLARAERVSDTKRLKTLPRFRKAAARVAAAITVLLDVPQARDGQVMTLAEMWTAIEQVVPREKLQAALVTVAEYLPDDAEDDDADWRTELVTRYATVTGFLELLAETIAWGATPAGAPIVAALRGLPRVKVRRTPEAAHIQEHAGLVTGSWRRLVYANPQLTAPLIDKHAYVFCVLEHLHRALRHKDVYALGADRWGDPRARLPDGDAWEQTRPRVLSALGLPEQATDHLAELVSDLDATYRHVAAGLPTNSAVQIEGGRIRLDRLAAAPDPAGMEAARDAVAALLPRVDYAELLLEVFERTGLPGAFTHISGSDARPADFDLSLAGVLVAESTNIGLVPVTNPAVRALTRGRLLGADQAYVRAECMSVASARLVGAQDQVDITTDWGGGLVAGADGMRFVVPVRSIAARPSAKYFAGSKRRAGATWLNVVSDKVMGLGGLVVPGTPRDSLHILDALHNLDVDEPPEIITTDTGSYSDLVFGLFAISGYQFSPRIADLADTRLWRTRPDADYGPLNTVSGHTVNLARIVEHWQDTLRVAGSLITGEVRAHDVIRMLTREGNPTGLGNAFVAYGRLFKTLHVLQVLHDESYRRMIGAQQNIIEGRHNLARRIFFGNRGELRQRYQTGMEDQVGALGLALNCVVLWNSWYIDAAVTALEASGMALSAEIRSRLSPLIFEHINFHGSYPFVRPGLAGDLRPLRNPTNTDEQ